MRVKTSAPGKLMLFGEHSVVYNYPSIVTAVSSRLYVQIEKIRSGFKVESPQVKDVRFVEETVKVFKEKYPFNFGLSIKTKSDFSSQYGFGSSSAVTVALLFGLAKICGVNLSKKEIFDLGYQINLNVQGVGSGFDIAAATYGRTLYFLTGGKIIKKIKIDKIPLIVAYSGIKADTPKIVKSLKKRIDSQKSFYFQIFDQIKEIVEKAYVFLEKKDWKNVGQLMNENHRLLQKIGVSTKKLDQLCEKAVESGALGAKLSGAGGGDCMIALVEDEKKELVKKTLEKTGSEVIEVYPNVLGVSEDE